MRWLLFLSRLALICNVFFLLAVSVQMTAWIQNDDATALVVILGYFLAGIFNPIVNLMYLFLFLVRKRTGVPLWLRFTNFGFLILQVIYVLYLNEAHKQLNMPL